MWLSLIYLGRGSRHKFSLVKLNICQADLPCLICVCVFQRQRKKSHVLKCNVLSDVLNRAGDSPRDRRRWERSWKEISWGEHALLFRKIWKCNGLGQGTPIFLVGVIQTGSHWTGPWLQCKSCKLPSVFQISHWLFSWKISTPIPYIKESGKILCSQSQPPFSCHSGEVQWVERIWNLAKTSQTSWVLT